MIDTQIKTSGFWSFKNPVAIALTAGVIFLLWVAFRSCNPAPIHTSDKKEVDSLHAVISMVQKDGEKKIDSLAKVNQLIAKSKDSLVAILHQKQIIIREGEDEKQQLAQRILELSNEDPVAVNTDCDSLAKIVIRDKNIFNSYDTITNQILVAHAEEVKNLQDQINTEDSLYRATKAGFDDNFLKYNSLYKDYTKQVKANKFNKTLSRILSIALIAVGGYALLK